MSCKIVVWHGALPLSISLGKLTFKTHLTNDMTAFCFWRRSVQLLTQLPCRVKIISCKIGKCLHLQVVGGTKIFSNYKIQKKNQRNMFKVRLLRLKTDIETYLAKLCGVFNKRIRGIKTKYNQNYCNDKHKFHQLDVMYSNDGEVKPCVLYMHGGGWCAYDKRVFRSTCKRLCSCGMVVFNCNFRLAPKFSVEDMQQDIYAIIDYISANASKYGGNPENIVLAGDSAGAHLLSLFINKAILNCESVAKKVKGCAFFYGVYNLETTLNTNFKHLQTYMSSIVPTSTANYFDRLRQISPVNYVSASIPPTLICSGKIDTLNDSQSQQYAQILREHGVRVQSLIFPKEVTSAKHKFITFDTNKAAKRSFEAFGEFIKTL